MKSLLFLLLMCALLSAQSPVINEVMSLNIAAVQDEDGDYPDWIELYNPGDGLISLKNFALSDDADEPQKWLFPDITIPAKGWLLIFASDKSRTSGAHLHTNFKISSKGETLFLVTPDGTIADSLTVPPLAVDISYGRSPDGGSQWAYFAQATPGDSNDEDPAAGFAAAPRFSIPGGFYDSPQTIELSAPEGRIRYTTNGADPSAHSRSFTSPIRVDRTTVLKARAFVDGKLPSRVATHTFFINEEQNLPVLSMSTHPDNLFDDDIGIYVEGNGTALGGYENNPIGPPANYWEDWERPIHLELFEDDGAAGFSIDCGVKMAGKTTRKLPQKSFAVFMRNQYGQDELRYPLFPDSPVRAFRSFMLRNGGSDNTVNQGGVQFRDGLAARLVNGLDLEHQDYRPCALYINGEYWGIYSIREKLNEDYLAAHHGVDPANVDMLDDYHTLYPLVIEGDAEDYNALIDYLKSNSLADNAAAAYVETQMDVNNYLTYMAVEIYLANHDGPGHNSKFWRPRTTEGRYRWMLYDTDHSFGLRLFVPNFHYAPDAYKDDTIDYYLEPNGPSWPNPPESTFMFRKIMANRGFQLRFVTILADLLNSRFAVEQALQTYASVRDRIEPEIGRHLQRWGGSKSTWRRNTNVVETFLAERPSWLQDYIIDHFQLGGLAHIDLNIEPPGAGRIKLNSLTIDGEWSGLYFQDAPIQLNALANWGYVFDGWDGLDGDAATAVTPTDDMAITARFRPVETSGVVVINEINYNSPDDFDTGDWIELVNPLEAPIDLSGWTLVDDDSGRYVFAADASLPARGFIVLCRNAADFAALWPHVPTAGELPFGLNSSGDVLVLKNAAGETVDSVAYAPDAPWPWQANGRGATLALRDPNDDNLLAENWMASVDFGTPGMPNKVIGKVESQKPATFSLRVFPNPFNSTATIEYTLPTPGEITVQIYDLLGRLAADLHDGRQEAGLHTLKWQGRTNRGAQAPSGLYLVHLAGPGFSRVQKIVLVR